MIDIYLGQEKSHVMHVPSWYDYKTNHAKNHILSVDLVELSFKSNQAIHVEGQIASYSLFK